MGRHAHLSEGIVPEQYAEGVDGAAHNEHAAGTQGQRGEPVASSGLERRLLRHVRGTHCARKRRVTHRERQRVENVPAWLLKFQPEPFLSKGRVNGDAAHTILCVYL